MLKTCSVSVCSGQLGVLLGGFRTVDNVVSVGVCCVSMCSCFSLGSYFVLMLSDGCSVVLSVGFSVGVVGLFVLLAIHA